MSSLHPPETMSFTFGLAPDWRRYSFDWQAGRPAVVILTTQGLSGTLQPLLDTFVPMTAAFAERGADVLLLASAVLVEAIRQSVVSPSGIEIIECEAAFLADRDTPRGEPKVVVVDRNLRVALECELGDPKLVVTACLACIDRLTKETPAPVLILPNLVTRDFCHTLIARFERGDSRDGTVAGVNAHGMPCCYVDHTTKRRRDLQIPRDDPLYPLIREMLLARCIPEIEKAFHVRVAHTDRLMLARYDSTGGWFRRHRDNTTINTTFREFAISVNLNTEEYEGGFLIFPEYNDQPHCPPTGGGLIFSASLLHEVIPVSRGSRYALLTFFHSEAAENLRRFGNDPEPV